MENSIRRTIRFLLLLVTCLLAWACNGDDSAPTEAEPIAFAPALNDVTPDGLQSQRRSARSSALAHDFVLYGFKDTQRVFDGYTLTYQAGSAGTSAENSHNYSYIDVANNQTIKFWDYAASAYRFWGYVPHSAASYDKNTHTLTFSNVDATTLLSCLCSKTKDVAKAGYGHVVTLEFQRLGTTVEVRFFTSETLKAGDFISLTNISFAPTDGTSKPIVERGTLAVQYAPSALLETFTTTPASDGVLTALNYDPVTLTSVNISSPTSVAAQHGSPAQDVWQVFPHTSGTMPTAFTMTAEVNGDEKTAVVPLSYMNWLPNYHYTYIFKITEAGHRIEFYDVKIDPWLYGGSQEDEWKNW